METDRIVWSWYAVDRVRITAKLLYYPWKALLPKCCVVSSSNLMPNMIPIRMREADVWRYLFTFTFLFIDAEVVELPCLRVMISMTLEIKSTSLGEHWQSFSILLPSLSASGVPHWPICHIIDRCHHGSLGIHNVIIIDLVAITHQIHRYANFR